MRGAQTTEATNTLWNLSVAGCREHKTLILSSPAELKCAGREKHETEMRWLESEWQLHTVQPEKSSETGRLGRV